MSGYDVSSSFSIVDSMTPTLKGIITSMSGLLDSMDQVSASSKNVIDIGSLKASRVSLEEAKKAVENIKPPTDENVDAQIKHNRALSDGKGAANSLLGMIKGIAVTYGGIRGIQKVFDMSDTLSQTTARLNLVKDANLSINDAQKLVYDSAMRARQPYQQQIDMVSKLQLQAKNAFSSTAETVAFAEQLGKRFKIAGTDAQGIESVMYNLTQAMSSGVLRGQDLNSVLANAPSIVQDTAKYLGTTEDQIRKLAEEGQLTAQAVKNAMLSTAEETNAAFADIPMNISDMTVMAGNAITVALQPALEKINEIINTERFQSAMSGIVNLVGTTAFYFAELVGIGIEVFGGIAENIEIVLPVLGTLIGLLGVYQVMSIISGAASKIHEFGLLGAMKAQLDLNMAIMSSPIFWLLGGIVAISGALMIGVGVINKWKGTSYSAIGAVAGAFAVAGAVIFNTAIGVFNGIIQAIWTIFVEPFLGVIEFVLNAANGGFDSFGGAVANLIGQIIGWFLSLGTVVTKIIDAIFGTEWTAGLESLRGQVTSWGKNDDAITIDRNAPEITQRFDYRDTFNTAYDWGKDKQDSLNVLGNNTFDSNLFNPSQYEDQNIKDMISAIDGSSLASDTKDINKKKDKELNISNSQLEFIRSIAERNNLQNLTVGEVVLNFDNKFGDVHERADLDGFWEGIIEETKDAVSYGIGGAILES